MYSTRDSIATKFCEKGRRDRDRVVVGFATTCAISAYSDGVLLVVFFFILHVCNRFCQSIYF